MPCWELFDEQDEAYRAETLGPGTIKVAVEAGVTQVARQSIQITTN